MCLDALDLMSVPLPEHVRPVDVAVTPDHVGTAHWKDYLILTKPEITFLVTISALAGFLLGTTGAVDGWRLAWLLVGTALTSAGGGVLNHCLEHRYDAQMHRTASRPIPAGRIAPRTAFGFGLVLVAVGLGLLCPLTNPLTGVLAALTVGLYLFAYTPLKRITAWNTVVGTIPGALPALGGFTAATGALGAGGWALFAILVLWQFPHFFSLAWMYRKDYARGGFAMLPVIQPSGQMMAVQMVLSTVLLILASGVPVGLGLLGGGYLAGALLLGGWFLWPVLVFYRSRTTQDARRVLKASVVYIPLLVLLIVLDRLVF
jgi:protoheme IX farnesyltransferase